MAIESKESLVQLQPGDRFGDCVVRRLIGRGAMGSVYLVNAPDGAEFALKIVDPDVISRDTTFALHPRGRVRDEHHPQEPDCRP